jgi:hypothetical protein
MLKEFTLEENLQMLRVQNVNTLMITGLTELLHINCAV